jgi:NADP-dependent 3-hydroxy acid dehydrogenase YdfG
MSDIQDKVIIITGASSGIGAATARELIAKGAKLVLAARRESRLKELQTELSGVGNEVKYKVTDVASFEQMEELAAYTLNEFGNIDVIVNNAGIMPLSPLHQTKISEWNSMIDVNIKGVLYGIAVVLPHMRAKRAGHIINVSSIAGHLVFEASAVYSGTKFAVRAITEGLRMEEAANNIRTTIISPGTISTELLESISDPDLKTSIVEVSKIGIEPASIARAIAFAIEQPADVAINEMIVRPTIQQL